MKKIKLFLFLVLMIALNIVLIYSFQDILLGKYYELGTNSDADAVYLDAVGGVNYAEREHKFARFIPYGTEQFYAFVDNRDEENPILYSAIITDPEIMAKLDNYETVRLQGLKKSLRHDAKEFYDKVLNKLHQEAPELNIVSSNVVIDTTSDKTKAIMYLLFTLGTLVYSIWLFIKAFKKIDQQLKD